ncbi:hypothetical protein D9M68_572930 [compost metagenome]
MSGSPLDPPESVMTGPPGQPEKFPRAHWENWHGLCNRPDNSGFGAPGTGRPGNPHSYDRQADLQPPRLQKSRTQDSVAPGRPGFRGPWYRQAGESPFLSTGVLASRRRGSSGTQRRTASSASAGDHPSGGLGTGRPRIPLSYSARRLTSSRQRPSSSAACHSPCKGRAATKRSITPSSARCTRQLTGAEPKVS